MTNSTKLKEGKIILTLIRFNFIPKRKLSLFFIGVFIISLITTVMTGYVTGIQQKNYFFAPSNDVLILYDKKATTPITGYIEDSFVKDLPKINGIISVSPEIYSTGVITGVDKPAILHGITKTFLDIHPLKVLSGTNIFETNVTTLNNIMIGYKLSKLLDLKVNSSIHFNSALKEVSRTFVIAGIFRTNSPVDDELLSSMDNAIGFSWVPSGFVTLVQVKFNPSIITKSAIETLVSNPIINYFKVTQNGSISFSVLDYNIKVYNSNNRLVDNFYLNSSDFNLSLPFGSYNITVYSASQDFINNFNYYAKERLNHPILLPIKYDYRNLSLRVFYNNQFLSTFNLTISEQYSGIKLFNNTVTSSIPLIIPLRTNRYYVLTVNNGINAKRFNYHSSQDENITVILNTGFFFQVFNSSTKGVINNFNFSVYNATTLASIHYLETVYQGKFFVEIDPGSYLVKVVDGSFSGFYNVTVNPYGDPAFHQFNLGYVNVTFIPHGTNGTILHWQIYDNNTLIASHSSVDNSTFQIQSSHTYLIQVQFQSQTNQFLLDPQESEYQDVYFNNSYNVSFLVFNGSDKDMKGLESAKIEFSNGSTFFTNSSGLVSIPLQQMTVTTIYVSYLNYTYTINLSNLNQYQETIKLPVGNKIHLVIYSYSEQHILRAYQPFILFISSLTNQLTTINEQTPYNGIYDIYLPLSKTIGIITFNSENYFIGTTPSYVEVNLVFPPLMNINVIPLDINGLRMSNVYIMLHNLDTGQNIDFRGYTDSSGVLKIMYVLQGNYSVTASYKDLVQTTTFNINDPNLNYYVHFYINVVSLNANDYLHFNSFRNVKIQNPSQYVQTFLQSTFSIFLVTMIIAVFITILLMFLSMESIITFPLFQHKADIHSLQLLGASDNQLAIVLSLRLAYYSFFASFFGILTSYFILFSVSSIGSSNIGGLIFSPQFNPFITILSVVFIFIITFIISFFYLKRSLLPTLNKSKS